jgi:hypothetical protein
VERIINEAFRETMVDVDARMETRVRGADKEGSRRHENRTTGNMVYAAFVHMVSRPIDGIPDPHHIHDEEGIRLSRRSFPEERVRPARFPPPTPDDLQSRLHK